MLQIDLEAASSRAESFVSSDDRCWIEAGMFSGVPSVIVVLREQDVAVLYILACCKAGIVF